MVNNQSVNIVAITRLSWPCINAKYMLIWNVAFQNVISSDVQLALFSYVVITNS